MAGPGLGFQTGGGGFSAQRQLGQWPTPAGKRLLIAALYFFINFKSVHRNIRRGRDSNLHHLALYPDYLQVDASINNDAFTGFS
jgi:hypothetical protein